MFPIFRHTLLILLTTFLVTAVAIPEARALDLGGHDRDGLTVGVNLGAAWNKLEFSVPDENQQPVNQSTGTAVDFAGGVNVGWARNDYLLASIGIYGWKEGGWTVTGNPVSASTIHFMLELQWFPRGEGFWIKGGAGGGNLDFSTVTPLYRRTFQKGGWNFELGAGYEFRVADSVALGIAYDYRYLTVGQFEGLDDTKVLSSNLSLSIRYYAY